MIGIYKITSPSNRVYIGQSRDISCRFRRYRSLKCQRQPKLYNSFCKYGVKNHIYEIIEECELEVLNFKERYWQEYYDCVNNGLNCSYVRTDVLPMKWSKESLAKRSASSMGHKRTLGNKQTPESVAKRRASNKWTHHTEEAKAKMNKDRIGTKASDETILKQRLTTLNKSVIQLSLTGEIVNTFISISEAGRQTGIHRVNINSVIRLKTKTAGGYVWKFAE